MYPVLFRIPDPTGSFPEGLPIYGFGVMLFVAFLLCSWLAGRSAEKVGIKKEYIQDLTIYLFVGGLLGARIAYLIMQDTPKDVLDFFYKLPRIWDGGIILYGSLIGGFLGYLVHYFLVLRKEGITTGKVADVLAPALVLGIALGRIGCFCNGCCYGQVPAADMPVLTVSFPLGAPATQELVGLGVQTAAGFTVVPAGIQALAGDKTEGVRVDQVDPVSPAYAAGLRAGHVIQKVNNNDVSTPEDLTKALFLQQFWPRDQRTLTLAVRGDPEPVVCVPGSLGLHPTQLYETVSMFLLFLLLLAYAPFRTRDGQVMALMMICYAIHRYLNEQLRNDARPVGFESYGSVVMFVGGALLLAWLYWRPAQYRLTWDKAQTA